MRTQMQILRTLGCAAVLVAGGVLSAWAQQPQTVRIRGTIEKVDGNAVVVKAADGTAQTLTLAAKALIVGVVKASLAEIKPGYVRRQRRDAAAGRQPEGARGAHLPRSPARHRRGAPAVHGSEQHHDQRHGRRHGERRRRGRHVTVKYKEGEKKIVVGPNVPIVRYEIGDRSELKPGVHITALNAVKKPDGSIDAPRLNVGRNGLVPQ